MSDLYDLRWTRSAKRALAEELPENVAAAVLELILGPLRKTPYQVGKPVREPFDGMYSARRATYRVLYTVDDDKRVVTVEVVRHRRDAYRAG
ncbi:type II toxin-antitoxin system RelE family toxin [Actinorugispora endophytica]|uniref:mRNA-degrading endonuclease RelE of RelBE toxin-antitoxin system n=1 Tax=Actinorugispora endophytica TaxID=1605990 RepID=A0A4R6UM69_9ACTN|nr:type II toxin-antitoxin system RelE/ParE family toxin [Actinorugispora endophytica]TDQ48011.1 mRNA-degrading endonuclease RelE of RelBE toxin-antitoxin system [Actinorugispora endophytica]